MRRLIWFLGFLIGCLPISLYAQVIHYVSPNGSGDGSSWAQVGSLSDAIANASPNDQIWLREGVYEIDQTLEISYGHSGVILYGGFDGSETNLSERNIENNETILDGLGEQQILIIESQDVTLDGLTFRNGFIEDDNDGGGAIFIWDSGTTIRNCLFRDNIGAGSRGAGAIYNRSGTGLLIDNCLFENNRTQTFADDANGGGAIFSWASGMVINNSIFRNNASHNDGGAIYSWDSMALSDCVFEGNHSEKTGGAIRVHSGSTAVIRNVVFLNNGADGNGGAIYVGLSAETTIINCLFDANNTESEAGAVYNAAGLKVTNTTFVNNQRHAIVFRSFSGDEYYTYVYNSIFHDNISPEGTAPDLFPSAGWYTSGDVELRRNILQVDPHPSYTAAGNQIADPLFVDPSNNDYRLQPASSAIDAGRAMLFNGVSVPNAGVSTDLDGNPRLQGANIDMGAYEAEPPEIPECTIVAAPVDGGTDVALDADITWEAVADATGYRISIGTTSGGTDVVDGQEVTGTAFGLPEGFAENTTYYVTVVPYNAAGDATDCAEISFTTETLPVPPVCATITGPADGSTDVPLDAEITWEAVEDAMGYRITIGTEPGGTDVVDGQEVTGTVFSLPGGFDENTVYHVTVVPYNAAGSASDCAGISFTTEALLVPPSCATITGPSDGSTDVPLDAEIEWTEVEGATGYRISIGTTSGGTDVVDGQEVDGTVFSLPGGFDENTVYHVTVVPYNAAGGATDCAVISFTTETLPVPPDCATITGPADGATEVVLDADITWEAVDEATGYRISIGTSAGDTDVVDGQEVTGTVFSLPGGFDENTVYHVTVVPYNAAGGATDCAGISFTTEALLVPPNCATIIGPGDGGTDVPLDADITWEAVDEATGYRISIGTTSGGTDVVDGQEVTGTVFSLPGGFDENTTYYVTVVPYNAAGDATDCVGISFTTETLPVPPDCATITGPADRATDVVLNAEITWEVVEGATGYRITIGTTPGGTDVVDGQEVTGTAFGLPDGFDENTTYHVTMVPYNAAGEATDCVGISFTTETLPVPPDCTTITGPADGGTDVALDAEITWEAVEGATGYRVSIGTTLGGTDVVDRQEVTGTVFSLSGGFDENTTYYVTVVPYNAAGDATNCAGISFTTETLPVPTDCTTITGPADRATDVVLDAEITWEAVEGATGYRVTIGTTSDGTDVIDGQEVTGTAFSLPGGFDENTTYYVTVVPYNAAGGASGCTESSFTTETLPVPPVCATITGPADGAAGVALDADITWEAVEDAAGYHITIGTTPGGTDVVSGQEVTGTAFSLPGGFDENTTYHVTVVPYNGAGGATDCAGISFTTETLPVPPDCTTITGPADGATEVVLDADITWDAVEYATGYRISIGTTSGGTDVVDGQEVTGTAFGLPDGFDENTTYHVMVVPYNSAGDAADCVETSFTTEASLVPPGCTTITGPADGATDVALDADITWGSVEDATGYRISIGTTPGGTDVVDGQEVTGTVFSLPDGFAENTTYHVTVVPYNAAGDATDCGGISFTTETLPVPPNCATITAPMDGATDVALGAEIEWTEVEDATGYRISIGTTPGGTDVVDGQEITGTVFSLPGGFDENTVYHVTVVPYNAAGSATDCGGISFTTETLLVPPSCAIITNPVDGANSSTLDEGITWTAVENADGYRISIGTAPGGTELVDNEEVTGTRFDLAVDFAENTAYYIAVIPFNSAGEATTCGYTRFVIVPDENINRTKYGFSPNGDGINDFWKIEGIDSHPDNKVSIYNRWGDMVFQIEGYDNVSNVFKGEANRLTGWGARVLPSGTYFFVIQYRDRQEQKKVEGFLVLKR